MGEAADGIIRRRKDVDHMKRLICLMLMLCLMLSGCGGEETLPTTLPVEETTTAPVTEPAPTLLERARVWNEDGVLLELPLEQLEECTDLRMEIFGEHLLLWNMIYDNEWVSGIQMQLLELDYGTVVAEQTVPITDWFEPQIQEDRICICDSFGGAVTILDENLNVIQQWSPEADWNNWIMGWESELYIIDNVQIRCRDLETGEERTVMDRAKGIYASEITPDGANLWYTDVDMGMSRIAYLDFAAGGVRYQPFAGSYTQGTRLGDTWLCRFYSDGRFYRLGSDEQAWDVQLEGGVLQLMPEGYLLEQSVDGEHLYLYDLEGRYLTGCNHSRNGTYLSGVTPVWSGKLGGYLFPVYDYENDDTRLLFWNLENSREHPDLSLREVDTSVTEDDMNRENRERAEALGERYGLKIWVGKECQTEFFDFTATHLLDPQQIHTQLDILETALSGYPEGFFRQLRYGDYQQIHIHLVADLMAREHYGTGGSYGGFTSAMDGYYLMVINTNYAGEGTYYHEFSHIIDDYLEWDSWNREDALYSEEGWLALNPEGFDYTWDYAVVQDFRDDWDRYFIDQYAMINSTEDRARTIEYGMCGYMQWRFDEMPGTLEKLRWYAACIRDAFDTSGWTEELLWEQYL